MEQTDLVCGHITQYATGRTSEKVECHRRPMVVTPVGGRFLDTEPSPAGDVLSARFTTIRASRCRDYEPLL
ncbi:hypothetical protein RRG08_040823 [Elysia crispata]|uniref:Uncharacterized protein n=1 Tax=Elysia crispata TaxID=231223 RepID=A0AAE1DC79_9GAST|nr:hypothetical protein RRG08_040823 [Elysia crispata]